MLKDIKNFITKLINHSSDDEEVDFDNQNIKVSNYSYLLTRAVVPDIPELEKLSKIVYSPQIKLSEKQIEQEIQNHKQSLFLVVRHNDALIAAVTCHVDKVQNDILRIHWLGVSKNFRNRGIAKKMVETVIRKGKQMKLRGVKVALYPDDKYSQHLFSETGFSPSKISNDYRYIYKKD